MPYLLAGSAPPSISPRRGTLTRIFRSSLLAVLLASGAGSLLSQISSHRDWQKLPRMCASCHVGHGVAGSAMLPRAEEDFCYQCHGDFQEIDALLRSNRLSPTVRTGNIRLEFQKPSRHPVELASEIAQSRSAGGRRLLNPSRSECLDCHRGHGVSRPKVSPGVPKMSTLEEGRFEYELCYECHSSISHFSVARRDIKSWFDTKNPSFHPLESAGKNSDVPSLKEPYSILSQVNCTDCHNSDNQDGPRGPHGSAHASLLEKRYDTNDHVSEGPEEYALCYKCHDRESILADESFPQHQSHIVIERTSCFTCHSSHGSELSPHLMRFQEDIDPLRIQPSSSGRLEFVERGRFSGECFLTCHGADHNPKSYQRF